MRRSSTALLAAVAVIGATGGARADAPDSCLTAPVEGQRIQRDGKLIEARARFLACAQPTCAANIVADCLRWAQGVEPSIPSIVVVARDASGGDVLDARVAVDDKPSTAVSPRAIELDPGVHTVVVTRADSAPMRADVFVREGQKNREVRLTFPSARAPVGASPAPKASAFERPIPAAAWVFGGIGVVGIAGFAVFGSLGLATRTADHCDLGCTQSQKNDVDSKYLIANISLGVGVVAAGVAIWLFLTRPSVARGPEAH